MRRRHLMPAVAVLLLVPTGVALAAHTDATAPTSTSAAWVPALGIEGNAVPAAAFRDGTAYVMDVADTGTGATLYKSRDFGMTWSQLNTPTLTGSTTELRFGSPTFGVLLDNGLLRTTTDGGRSWSGAFAPPLPTGYDANSAAMHLAVSHRTVVVTMPVTTPYGNYMSGHVASVVAISRDGGRHWRRTYLPEDTAVRSLSVLGSRHILAAADHMVESACGCAEQSDGTSMLFRSSNGGRSFRLLLTTHSLYAQMSAVAFISPARIIVGFSNGATSMSNNGGKTFRAGQALRSPVFDPPSPNSGSTIGTLPITGFSFIGKVGYATANQGGIWRTADAGGHWSRELSGDLAAGVAARGGVAAFDAARGIAGGPKTVEVRVAASGP